MKNLIFVAVLSALASPISAQTARGSGGALPATCITGDAFYLQTIAAPSGWFDCVNNAWAARTAGGSGDMLAANNLSELSATAATARTNLGLGTLATQNGTFIGTTYVLLTANRTNATTSYADITDLVIPVSANTRYDIECKIIYSANATTTGIGIGWIGPASPTLAAGIMTAGLTSATVGGTTVGGNDTGGVTTASVGTSGNVATFEGIWSNGANSGNVQMRFKSEVAVASAIVIQAGSWCRYNTY